MRGQHRSVAMVELLGQALTEAGWTVSMRHRELERKGPGNPAPMQEAVQP
jgi:RNase adapter protein RapZ